MADIVLRDRNGATVEYPGVERVKMNTVNGETVEFVDSATVPGILEDLPIALDFSGGNQEIVAPDGFVVKSAIIQLPKNLIPENIPKDMDIAGIIGTRADGGGSGKVAYGVFKPTVKQPNTITHDLGMLPDLVLVCIAPRAYPNKYYSELVFAVSEAFSTLNGGIQSNRTYSTTSDYGDTKRNQVGTFVENTYTGSGYGICNANETSFTIRNNLDTAYKYLWIAVAGLT